MQFQRFDTKQPDGVRVTFERQEAIDQHSTPFDWMSEEDDAERIAAWRRDDWHFVGIRAVAHVQIIRNGTGTLYTLESAGLWGIESDSGEEYFAQVFEDEKAELAADIAALSQAVEVPA